MSGTFTRKVNEPKQSVAQQKTSWKNLALLLGVACGIVVLIAIIASSMSGRVGNQLSSAEMMNAIPSEIVIPVILIAFGFLIYCAIKESAITGTYKAFNVYGRVRAYLLIDALLFGIIFLFFMFFAGFSNLPGEVAKSALGFIASCAVAILIYMNTRSRCPEMLRDRLLISMIITGLGVTMKVVVFFIGVVWTLVTPPAMVDTNGNTVYVINKHVYDASGQKVGVVDPYDSSRFYRYRS